MGKTRGFLAFFTFVFIALFGANAFADGYACSNAMNFVSCGSGFKLVTTNTLVPGSTTEYMKKCEPITQCNLGEYVSDNGCITCPAGYACNGVTKTECPTTTENGAIPTWSEEGATECTPCTPNPDLFGNLVPAEYEFVKYDGGNNYNGAYGCFYVFENVPIDGGTVDHVKCDGEEGYCWYIGESLDDLQCNAGYSTTVTDLATLQNILDKKYMDTPGGLGWWLESSTDLLCKVISTCDKGYYINGNSCQPCPTGSYCEGGVEQPKTCPPEFPYTDTNATEKDDCYVTIKDGYFMTSDGKVNTCLEGQYGNKITQSEKVYYGTDLSKYSALEMCTACPQPVKNNGALLLIKTSTPDATSVTNCYIPAGESIINTTDNTKYSFTQDCYADLNGEYNCPKTYTQCPAGQYVDDGACQPCEKGYACDGIQRTACSGDKYSDEDELSQCKSCPNIPTIDGLIINWNTGINAGKSSCDFVAEYSTSNGKWSDVSCAYSSNDTYLCALNDNVVCNDGYTQTSEPYTQKVVLSSDNLKSVVNSYCVAECGVGYTLDTCDDNLKYAFGVCLTKDGLASGYTSENCDGTFKGNGCAAGLDDSDINNDQFIAHYDNLHQCLPNIYKITLNDNSGTGGTQSIYEKYATGWYANADATQTISSVKVPTRNGFEFLGYMTSCNMLENPAVLTNNTGKITASTKTFLADTTVNACWGNRKYTVTLNNNGGTGGTSNTISMKYNVGWYNCSNELTCNITKLAVPTRNGYTFGGYYYNNVQVFDGNGNLVDGNTTVYNGTDNGFTLTAKWTANVYKVTLTNLTPWSTASGRVVYLCYDKGWYTNSACSGAVADLMLISNSESWTFSGVYSNGVHTLNANAPSVTAFTSDITLAAQWNQETIACESGKYYPGTGTTLLDCKTGSYCPDGADKSVVLGTTNACQPQSCPTASTVHGMSVTGTSDANAKHETECYIDGNTEFTDKSGTYTCTDANYNGTTYNCTKVYNKCAKGLYLDGNQCTTCPAGHICTGGDALPEQCTNGTYADTEGMFACKVCPTPKYDQYATVSSSDDGKSCVVKYNMLPVNNGKVSVSCGGTDTLLCSIANPSTDADSESDYMMCNAGYYAPNGSASVNVQNVVIDDLMSKIAAVCQPSGIGYYTPADSMTREQCPTTEITVDENETVTGTTSTPTASDASQCHVPSTIEFTDDNGTYTCGGNTAYDKDRQLYNCTKVYSKCVAGQRPIDGQCEPCPNMPYAGGTFGLTTNSVVCPVVYNKYINVSNGKMYVSNCEYDTNNRVYVCKSGDSIVNCNKGYYIANINEYVANNTIIATPTCTPATQGHYADGLGGYAQKACVAGTYQDQTGASACKPAQPGYYVENDAATAQTLCVGTTYSDKAMATQCIVCPALGIKTAQNVRASYDVLHNSTNGTVNTLHDSQNGCAWTFDMPIANGKLENISCNVGEKCTVPVSALTCNSGHGFNTTDIELSSGAFIVENSNIADGDFANVCSVCAGDSYSASGTAGTALQQYAHYVRQNIATAQKLDTAQLVSAR